jgi:hypothetical protein
VLKEVRNHFAAHPSGNARFHPLSPAQYLLTGGRKLRKLPGIEPALTRFEQLFTELG